MPNVVSISSGKRGFVRRKLKIRRAESAAELRRGLRLKSAANYKIHNLMSIASGPQISSLRKLKPIFREKRAVAIAAVGR
jgi:hypothetical protein